MLVFLSISVLCWSRSVLHVLVLLRGKGFTPALIFSLGPFTHFWLAPDSVPHAEAGSHGSVGFLCAVKTRQGDSFDQFYL
jgi:hypothetical protein